MAARVRLDQLIVQRALAPSRERAQALILAGAVRVNGEVADRAAAPVSEAAAITIATGPKFVSRGGDKLEGALEDFSVDVAGKVVLDVGSSTGGFTDSVLQRGALRVYAIDVGKGQLDWKLRNDPRVVAREGLNASFISLRLLLPTIKRWLTAQADVIPLIKPQFEAGRESVGRGGIVRDPKARAAAVVSVAEAFTAVGLGTVAIAASHLAGREGNREIFLHCRKGEAGLAPGRIRERAAEAAESVE